MEEGDVIINMEEDIKSPKQEETKEDETNQKDMGKSKYTDVLSTTTTLITGAFSFVAALAWRDAVKRIFEIGFGKRTSIKAYLLYALVVTLIAIIIVSLLAKVSSYKK